MAGKLTELKAQNASVPIDRDGRRGDRVEWDSELRGFGLRIRSSGAKSWIVKYRADGRQRVMTIGNFPNVTEKVARREARRISGEVAMGNDPAAAEQQKRVAGVTLAKVLDDYLAARTNLKPVTTANYRRVVGQHLADWQERPLAAITSDMVQERYGRITKAAGPGAATLTMRTLGALFAFAMEKYRVGGEPIIARNPVSSLKTFGTWHRFEARQTVIKAHELPTWWAAVQKVASTRQRDYLVLVLLTGLRRREASTLRWSDIDLVGRTLTIPAARAKGKRSHVLPLGPYLLDLLKRRQAEADGDLVFRSDRGGQLSTSELTARVAAASGVPCTVHDLRRTFASIAESLDVPAYALKRLLNHAGDDVTSGYLIITTERLRKPMEAIEKYILSAIGETPSTVVTLRQEGA